MLISSHYLLVECAKSEEELIAPEQTIDTPVEAAFETAGARSNDASGLVQNVC